MPNSPVTLTVDMYTIKVAWFVPHNTTTTAQKATHLSILRPPTSLPCPASHLRGTHCSWSAVVSNPRSHGTTYPIARIGS